MKFRGYNINFTLLFAVLAAICIMTFTAQYRMKLSSNVLSSVPSSDAVLTDAIMIFDRYKLPDKVAVDLFLGMGQEEDRDRLAGAADFLEAEMKKSGLFDSVGTDEPGAEFALMLNHISENLPAYFSAKELKEKVAPLLTAEKVNERLAGDIELLGGFEGMGQSEMISSDPLGLRFMVLERLRDFSDAPGSTIYKGHIFNADYTHALAVAHTKNPGMDTTSASHIEALFDKVSKGLSDEAVRENKAPIKLSAIGSYRSALDNERTARKDVIFAAIFSIAGIALILITCFPRPYIGILSLLPGLAGTTAAIFVLSIFRPGMSMLALGFGGAILSFTVDSGISFFLFLDRTSGTTGKDTAHEIFSVELMAMLTTAGAFSALIFSGFEIMAEVGMFAALGAVFTFMFVHIVQPQIFRGIPPAGKSALLPVERIADFMNLKPGWAGFAVAAVFAAVMAFYASPVFNADLNRMNAVGRGTLAAEEMFRKVWGDVFSRVYFLAESDSVDKLRDISDRTALFFAGQASKQALASYFTISEIMPGNILSDSNMNAWREFWTEKRLSDFREVMGRAAKDFGFRKDAFEPFFKNVSSPQIEPARLDGGSMEFLGLIKGSAGEKNLLVSSAMPGVNYSAQALFNEFHSKKLGSMLDYRLFTERLSAFVHGIFFRTLLIVGGALAVVLLFYYLDLVLALLTLLPVAFSIVCTFGIFTLSGHPLDIPGLMLAVVVLGIGMVFSVYIVRMQQRYMDENHPSMSTIRASVLMAAAVILAGFSVLAFARHPLLSSAGMSTSLGILFTFAGTSLLLPPLLRIVFRKRAFPMEGNVMAGSSRHRRLVMSRFRHLESYARMFARFKMKFDPMFDRLADFVRPGMILDAGCGYGVQGVWLKTLFPGTSVCGLDPDAERVRIARRVLDDVDEVHVSAAQDFTAWPERIDTALMLDMAHYIDDEALLRVLGNLRKRLVRDGRLVIRLTVPSEKSLPWERWLEVMRNRLSRNEIWLRSREDVVSILECAGFRVVLCEPTVPSREETWFVAEPSADGGNGPC